MLNWKGAVDQKQDEGNKKLDEATSLINQLQSTMNMLIGMNEVLALKLWISVVVDNLAPSESMCTNEVHEGTNPLNNVLEIIVVNGNGVVHEHLVGMTKQAMHKDVHASKKCDLQGVVGAQEGTKEVLGFIDVVDNVNMPPIATILDNQPEKARLIMLTYCTIISMN